MRSHSGLNVLAVNSQFQLPSSRSRTNLTSPTNDAAAPAGLMQSGGGGGGINPNGSSVRRNVVNLSVANGIYDGGRRKNMSLMTSEMAAADAARPLPPSDVAPKRAGSASKAALPERGDPAAAAAAVLVVPTEPPQSTKTEKRRRNRQEEDVTDSIAVPRFSQDTVV